uniref:Uncharacterized protein n=1 Tax=Arundo donax TaxID=35708 RepID=A0A0A9DGH0_ARUDO
MMYLTFGKSKPLAAISVDTRIADFSEPNPKNDFLRSSWSMLPCKRNTLQLRNFCFLSISSCRPGLHSS